MTIAATSGAAAPGRRAWDPLVRLTHWGVAAAVLLNGLITEGGEGWHVWIGYAAAALLGLRLLWGLTGPEEARFSAFPPSLTAARAHLSDLLAGRGATPQRSHNPLGALNVYAMWTALAVVAATGLWMGPEVEEGGAREASLFVTAALADEGEREHEDEDEASGAVREGEAEEDEALEEIHESAANLLLLLAALHLGGVAVETRRGDRALLGRMLGRDGRGDGAA